MSTRIAFPFTGDTIGGSHISAASLMRLLPSYGYSAVAVLHQDGPLTAWLSSLGIPILRVDLPIISGIGGAGAIVRLATLAPKLAFFLRRENFSLVHANDGRTITTWMPAARLAGVKSLAHRRTKWAPSRLSHLTLRMADMIVAISRFVHRSLPDDLRDRAVVIANPFDLDIPARSQARQIVVATTGADAPTFAFVGTLQRQKRPDVFLRAAANIRKRCPDTRFLLVGRDGEIGMEMRHLARDLGLSDATTFAGFRSDVLALIAGSDMLLAPAIDEGHGRALIEAMVCGIPVVAADSGGHAEIVRPGETGLLVPPDAPEALAEAAIGLIQAPTATHDMTAAASRWVGDTFSVQAHAQAIAACYRSTLSK